MILKLEVEMNAGTDNVNRLSQSLEKLMLKLQEVDDACIELCKDISHQELSLIGYIGLMGEVIMREIAGHLETPLSTATWIVDKLVAKKYLKRYNSIEDRRIVKVGLTSKGQKTYELFRRLKISMGERMLQDLSLKDQSNLISLLEKVTKNLNNHVKI